MTGNKEPVYKPPSDEELVSLFQNMQKIAVVGLSPKEDRPSHRVAKHMQSFGYEIIPVRPAVQEILGQKAYASIDDLPFKVDLVDIFRASKYVPELLDQCVNKETGAIWLQEGVVNHESAIRAQQNNIFTIMDRCLYKEYIRLMR